MKSQALLMAEEPIDKDDPEERADATLDARRQLSSDDRKTLDRIEFIIPTRQVNPGVGWSKMAWGGARWRGVAWGGVAPHGVVVPGGTS